VETVAPDSEQMIFNQIVNLQVSTDIFRGLISYRLLSFFGAILFKNSELARRVPMISLGKCSFQNPVVGNPVDIS